MINYGRIPSWYRPRLDGVCYNFGDSVKRYLDHIGKGDLWKSGPNPIPYWDFYKDWGMTSREFVDLCNAGADAGFIFCGPTRDGAVEAINHIYDAGHKVVIITDRAFGSTPAVSEKNTLEWLSQHGFKYHEVIFSADKTIVPTDLFVEDKIDNYDALENAGCKPFLVNRAWNLRDDNRRRLRNVLEFASVVDVASCYEYVI